MDYIRIKFETTIIVVVLALSAISCNKDPSVFTRINMASLSLDYPYLQEHLEECRADDNRSCLKSFNDLKAAKELLFSQGRHRALTTTLETIKKACSHGAEGKMNTDCGGAVIALYFFSTPQESEQIRGFFSNTPSQLLVRVLAGDTHWLFNRQDRGVWRKWAGTLEIEQDAYDLLVSSLDAEWDKKLSIDLL